MVDLLPIESEEGDAVAGAPPVPSNDGREVPDVRLVPPDGLNLKLEQIPPHLEHYIEPAPPVYQLLRRLPVHLFEVPDTKKFRHSLFWATILCTIALAISVLTNYLSIPEVHCQLPVLSQAARCGPQNLTSPDFRKLIPLQSQLQRAMEQSAGTYITVHNMKRSEIAVRDLSTLVGLSNLVAKDRLAKNLERFADDAKDTSRRLQQFGGRVGSAVEEVIALNGYTIELLESVSKDQNSFSIKPAFLRNSVAQRENIMALWEESTGTLKKLVEQLISEAVANTFALDRLDNQLEVIGKMATRENRKFSDDKSETLDSIWTTLGGNKGRIEHFESHLDLLKQLTGYRKEAVGLVHGALIQLKQLEANMVTLNDHVSAPLLAKKGPKSPLQVQIEVMRRGTARLLEARAVEREREATYMQKILGENEP